MGESARCSWGWRSTYFWNYWRNWACDSSSEHLDENSRFWWRTLLGSCLEIKYNGVNGRLCKEEKAWSDDLYPNLPSNSPEGNE